MKTCSRCGQDKPLAEFWADARKPDGHRSACRTCITRARLPAVDTTRAWTPDRAFREYMRDKARQ